jgi:hypothetical protein
VVAELVTYELETLPEVVTAIGEVAEPEIKPLSDATGPENVVLAILIILTCEIYGISVCMSSAGTVRYAG